MTLSQLVTKIKMRIGIYNLPLPLDNPDQGIIDVIQNLTIPTFSQFFPHRVEATIPINDMECENKNYDYGTYILPKKYYLEDLVMIMSCEPLTTVYNADLYGDYYGGNPLMSGTTDLYHNMMNLGMAHHNMSMITPPFTFNFIPPNKMVLYNVFNYAQSIKVMFGFRHANDLATIKPTMEEEFTKLAILDTKQFLYNNLKLYKTINTAVGTIELPIDDWESAEGERLQLVDHYNEVYHLDIGKWLII